MALLAASCGGDDAGDDAQASEQSEPEAPAEWVHLGLDLANTRAVTNETAIGAGNVASLEVDWELTGVDGVSGTPIVADGVVYIGDWMGTVRALDAETGDELWAEQLVSRITGAVAIDDERVFAGTFSGTNMVALNRESGEVEWEVQLDEHGMSAIYGSPVSIDGMVIVGVGGFENFVGGVEEFTFRGSLVALDAETGEEVWRHWTTCGPENADRDNCAGVEEEEGPGVSIWSSPAIDTERGHVYIGTGQHYDAPATGRSDAVIALDLTTGEEAWVHQYTEGDIWGVERPNGLDADVGAPPNLFEADGVDAVGAGDKDGVYKALHRDTGEELWSVDLSDGSAQGGVMASAAVVDGTVFVTANREGQDADLVALDADDGGELWRVDVEGNVTGPISWANGVLYLGDNTSRVAAYDAADGERLWSHEVDAPAAGGVAVVDGAVYAGWGWWLAGAPEAPQGGLTAFRLPGGEQADDPGEQEGDGSGEASDGATIYQQNCATCHGGDGSGANGPALTDVGERLTIEDQLEVVRDGRAGMPSWEDQLTRDEIQAVVDYLQEF